MQLHLTLAESRLVIRALQRQVAEDRKYAEGQRVVRRNEFNDNAESMD